jgi:hypothetical protein
METFELRYFFAVAYSCKQTIAMIADRPQDTGWLHRLF